MTRLKRRWLWLLLVIALLVVCKLAWFAMLAPPRTGFGAAAERADLAARRAYLLERVARAEFGVADMPLVVASPYRQELAIATMSMTTVALTNLAFRDPAQAAANREAIRLLLDRMLSPEIRRYDVLWWGEDALDSLQGTNGHVGYLGHLNLVLGCYFLLGGSDASMRTLFDQVSATLARRLTSSGTFHAESFPGWTYTADIVVVILSLHLHDMAFGPVYGDLIRGWLTFCRARLLDPGTGMLRYHVTKSGQPLGTSRGVLQAWNSMWLPLIDEPFARDQFQRMRGRLLAQGRWLGLAAIREYPAGQSGPTDLVSGPLVFGLSPTASGFAMGGAAYWNDRPMLTGLLRSAEAAGFTWSFGGTRHYLLSPLLGDAIMLASRTMVRWDTRFLRAT